MGGAISPGLKGAISRMDKFVKEHRPTVARRLAPKIDQRYRNMATNETDVYGKPFAPLAASTLIRKARSLGGPLILTRTNQSWNATRAYFDGKRVVIEIGPKLMYAQEGDSGRGNRPPRRVLPSQGIPKTWTQDTQASADEVARRAKL